MRNALLFFPFQEIETVNFKSEGKLPRKSSPPGKYHILELPMSLLESIAALVTLTAAASYLNHRFLKLPTTIGLMFVAIMVSLVLLALGTVGFDIRSQVEGILKEIDFSQSLMNGMLSFLLFAGALHVKFEDLKENWAPIALLATIGVTISVLIVSSLIYLASRSLGVDLSPSYALVFGCLISPTDPIAVLGILKNAKVSKSLETQITGESLFNDGVGVVLFIATLSIATQSVAPDSPKDLPWVELGMFFIQEAVGGIAFGLILGYAVYRILRSIDDYKVEILTTVAAVFGGMTVASHLHFSAPLSMVIVGLFIGNQGRKSAMSKLTLKRLDDFWELIDEILNAVLFVFLGLELIVIPFNLKFLSLGFSAIFIVLLARAISIALPMSLLSRFRWTFGARTMAVMTWGGLRGGISVALALQIPDLEVRQLLLVSTYCVVVFSILVQGLTLKKLITWKTSGNAT